MSPTGQKHGAPASIAWATVFTPTACCSPSTRPAIGARRWRSPAAGRRPSCRCAAPMRWRWACRRAPGSASWSRRSSAGGSTATSRPIAPPALPSSAVSPIAPMPRPSLTFALWLAIALFVLLNNLVGDTWIGATLSVRVVEWYKVLVPLPYFAMLAAIHARRTAGPRWLEAALLAALLWPVSTVVVDFLYARFVYADDPASFLDRFAFWWGAPYPLLVLALFAAPLVAGALHALPARR